MHNQLSGEDPTYCALELDRQLCFPIQATARAVSGAYAGLLAEVGLTYPQYLAMLALWDGGPQTVGRLGERLHLDSGTLTPLLKRLEAAGRVRRSRDPEDERRVVVAPTQAGWALREQVVAVPAALAARIGLSAADYDELRRLLGLIQQHLADQ